MKQFKACLAVVFFSLSTLSYADQMSQYASTQSPLPDTVKKFSLHPPTNITIINASNNYIYAIVPGSRVNDYVTPGTNLHIYNYDASTHSTPIVLQDPYRAAFYNRYVCPLAIVTVYGYPGNYQINYDENLCF